MHDEYSWDIVLLIQEINKGKQKNSFILLLVVLHIMLK
jgi:hypothetical protein